MDLDSQWRVVEGCSDRAWADPVEVKEIFARSSDY
jgi:hypothetical protein